MNRDEFFKESKKLIECTKDVYLSTYNNEFHAAETRAMANLRSKEHYPQNLWLFEDDDLSTFIITSYATEKIEQIKNNENISLYYYCPDAQSSLTLFGKAEIINDIELKNKLWSDEWKYYFKDGMNDPNYAIIKFYPNVGKFFNRNYEKTIIKF